MVLKYNKMVKSEMSRVVVVFVFVVSLDDAVSIKKTKDTFFKE